MLDFPEWLLDGLVLLGIAALVSAAMVAAMLWFYFLCSAFSWITGVPL